MDNLPQILTKTFTDYSYLLGFAISLLENSIFLGLLVPGDTVALLAGFLSSEGTISLPVALLAIITGSAIGDNLGFLLGRRKGRDWLLKIGPKLGYKTSRIQAADKFWDDHGEKAIVIGDLISYVRTFVPFFAGTSKIGQLRFALWDFLAVSLHAGLLVALGYFFGEQWEKINDIFGVFGFLLFVVFVAIIFKFLKRKRARK